MIEDFGEMNTPNPNNLGELADGLGERMLVLRHDSIVVSHTILSRGNAIENEWALRQIGDMNLWPQRSFARDKVLEYRKAKGLAPEQFAEMLGVRPSHLHGLLYDKRTHPTLEFIQKLASILSLSISELADDPGGDPPPGITPEDYRAASEEDRVYLRAMGSDLGRLTPDQKRNAVEAWKALVRGITGS